ncbi:anthrax toxin-like adenylyl cyclase domain-containing protein, partial [Bacillus cereus]|uniref:anthrax toxin-like adenylyl cyclase domain-containing protein n=1 Tax=Bacillus cereus TaxID=1396 RepID=UPI00397F0140
SREPIKETRENKIKTQLEGINVYDEKTSIKDSGLVTSHVENFKNIAEEKQTYILFRPVNKLSTSLIAEGAATKGMNVHGKSSDWGPMAGYIPYDADLSKKHGSEKDVKKGNDDNTHSIAENAGVIDKIQLSISDARIKELKDENIIKDTKSENHYDVFDLNKNADVYEFRRERSSRKVEYKTQNGKKSIVGNEITDWKPLEVMGKIVDQQTKPLTADYDMFGLAPSLEKVGKLIPKEEMKNATKINVPLEKFKNVASLLMKYKLTNTSDFEGKDTLSQEEKDRVIKEKWDRIPQEERDSATKGSVDSEQFKLDAFKNVANLLIKYGLTRTFDPEKGKLTQWQQDMIDDLNTAARAAGYKGGTVVNHGTEQDNTEFPEQDKEIFIITPDRKTVLTKSWEDTQKFIQKNITEKEFLYYINRSYNKTAGGNKAEIPWLDPLNPPKNKR